MRLSANALGRNCWKSGYANAFGANGTAEEVKLDFGLNIILGIAMI